MNEPAEGEIRRAGRSNWDLSGTACPGRGESVPEISDGVERGVPVVVDRLKLALGENVLVFATAT